jgi:hypothetical protein
VNFLKTLSALNFLLCLSGCSSQSVCSTLSEKSKNHIFIKNMERWVDENESTGKLLPNNKKLSSDPPGDYLLEKDDFFRKAIGDDLNASVVTNADGDIESVFFFKESFRGFLVLVRGENNSIVRKKHLSRVSDRTFLICIEKE